MPQTTLPPKSPRLHLLDEVRGFAVLCMVFFHAFYTMSESFGMAAGSLLLDFFMPAEIYFAGLFILLSGFSCRLSRSNAKRGGILFGIAAALTGATLLLEQFGMPGTVIWFGILHLLSLCMLSFALLKPLLDRIPPVIGVVVCAVLFLLFYPISEGSIGLPGLFSWNMPAFFYQTDWFAALGMYSPHFYSADYFPLFLFSPCAPLSLSRAARVDCVYCPSAGYFCAVMDDYCLDRAGIDMQYQIRRPPGLGGLLVNFRLCFSIGNGGIIAHLQ